MHYMDGNVYMTQSKAYMVLVIDGTSRNRYAVKNLFLLFDLFKAFY